MITITTRWLYRTAVAGAIGAALSIRPAPMPAQSVAADEPLAALAPLVGTWEGSGTGFSTRLHYRWVLPGTVLEASNEVRNGAGEVVGRYHGNYVWDGGRGEIAFLTAGANGEVHRGRAWWRDGVLWHEAEVSGGRIGGYASAVRPEGGRLAYFADYGTRTARPALLESEPLVYVAVADALPPTDEGAAGTLDLDWYRAELARLAGDGGWWLASNSAHADADGGIEAYGVRHWLQPGGVAAGGCLWSIRGAAPGDVLWGFQQGWNGARQEPYYYQSHAAGGTALGIGAMRTGDTTVVEQEFWWPDGTTGRTRHTTVWLTPDAYETHSATWSGAAWAPGRTYRWTRQPPGRAPCGP